MKLAQKTLATFIIALFAVASAYGFDDGSPDDSGKSDIKAHTSADLEDNKPSAAESGESNMAKKVKNKKRNKKRKLRGQAKKKKKVAKLKKKSKYKKRSKKGKKPQM